MSNHNISSFAAAIPWKFLSGDKAGKKRAALADIAEGMMFTKVGHWGSMWVVERIFFPQLQTVPHIVLRRTESKADRVVISQNALLDQENFQLAEGDPQRNYGQGFLQRLKDSR